MYGGRKSNYLPMTNLSNDNPLSVIRYRALSLLARREHSFIELLSKLTERFPDNTDLVEGIVATLGQQNLQSDQRFAEMLVAARIRRGYGPVRIQAELKYRGVSKNITELALIESGANWFCLAKEALSKKYGSGACDEFSDKVKRSSFLQYRGFKSDHISACFK